MTIFRNPFGFDPGSYGNQGTGGLAALLQQAIERQRGDKSSLLDVVPDRSPTDANNSPGLFAQLLASQSNLGSLPIDPSFRQLSRLSPSDSQEQSTTPNSPSSVSHERFAMGRKPTYSECVDQCLHLLPSPSGDLQSSEFRQCVGKCMGRL
jgi:hypothetical protein